MSQQPDIAASALILQVAAGDRESICSGGCADAWPPLTTDGEPQAGANVDASLLATLDRDDGSAQVTYNGSPLYYFAQDANPGEAAGQGIEAFGGFWWVVGPDGEPIQEAGMTEGGGGDDGGLY